MKINQFDDLDAMIERNWDIMMRTIKHEKQKDIAKSYAISSPRIFQISGRIYRWMRHHGINEDELKNYKTEYRNHFIRQYMMSLSEKQRCKLQKDFK